MNLYKAGEVMSVGTYKFRYFGGDKGGAGLYWPASLSVTTNYVNHFFI